eukprot:2946238-Pyramimonas_sp.AAC.1
MLSQLRRSPLHLHPSALGGPPSSACLETLRDAGPADHGTPGPVRVQTESLTPFPATPLSSVVSAA